MKKIPQIIEEALTEMCDKYCKYSCAPVPEGKDEDWLMEDPDSPCQTCSLNNLC